MTLTAEQLLAGEAITHGAEIPSELLGPNGAAPAGPRVVLRPLTVRDLQRIGKAARDDEGLSASLMIQQALVEPPLKPEQVAKLPAGLARFLIERINAISGISTSNDALAELVQAPLAKACFVLDRLFGWPPILDRITTTGLI